MALRRSLSHLVVVIIRLGSREMERKGSIQFFCSGPAKAWEVQFQIACLQRWPPEIHTGHSLEACRLQGPGMYHCSSDQAHIRKLVVGWNLPYASLKI